MVHTIVLFLAVVNVGKFYFFPNWKSILQSSSFLAESWVNIVIEKKKKHCIL